MSIILHIDFNSFFASVEQQANPFLRGKAIAVGGKGRGVSLLRTVVTTASKEAKKLGIKTAMSSTKAMRLLPNLIMIEGDPHKYSEITRRFLAILRRYADAVEQFSADEAFADITRTGGDYLGAIGLALQIKNDIARECGAYCTISIGIAPNKLIAKLAGESHKPDGLTVVTPRDLIDFIDSQPLPAFCGIGNQSAKKLSEFGINSVPELRRAPLDFLRSHFKSYGDFLYSAARGAGDDRISDNNRDPKSIGHSYTFPYDLEIETEIKTNLLALCDKVAFRLRRDEFFATQISVFLRYKGFTGIGGQCKITSGAIDGLEIYKNAYNILERIRNKQLLIRLLGVSVAGLIKSPPPSSLFLKDKKMRQTLKAFDALQQKFGNSTWRRGATLNTLFLERTSGWNYDHEL